MKRQAAFAKNGNKMLKGALHCHTTRSDGQGTPEEVFDHPQHERTKAFLGNIKDV